MTWTSAFGRGCGWLLDRIVYGLALTRISPNVLTFIGLVINIVAAVLFGHANAANSGRMFFYAGLVIFGAGIFDMVDGRVARSNNQVTVFGSFFDSVIDRYSDVVLFFGLLVYYGRINRFRYVVLVAFVMVTSLMVSYTRARAEALIGQCKGGFMSGPVQTYNWNGQFEDGKGDAPTYRNLSRQEVCQLAGYLLEHSKDHAEYVDLAEELLRSEEHTSEL